MNFKKFFQILSYLQYPLILVALFFIIEPIIISRDEIVKDMSILFSSVSKSLIFMGLAISFSTLQDTSKSQHRLARKIWQNPKKGKFFLKVMIFNVISYFLLGVFGYLFVNDPAINDLAIGAIVLSISLIGMLKMGLEMFEKQRLDKEI